MLLKTDSIQLAPEGKTLHVQRDAIITQSVFSKIFTIDTP